MKVLIVSAGKIPSKDLFLKKLDECELSIAADNGLGVFYKYNVVPDIIIGDLDSSDEYEINYFNGNKSECIRLETEKNMTDTEAAIDIACDRGADNIILLGATGKRIDHLLANLMLLRGSIDNNYRLVIEDDEHEIYAADGEFLIKGFKGQTVSLFPTDGSACVNAIFGVYYPLDNLLLKNTHSRGISNVMTEDTALIKTDKPLLVVKIKNKV